MAINSVLLLLCVILVSALPLRAADKISVAAAADLNVALTEITAHYGKQSGNSVEISFGSSGNFFHQVQNGAPFDFSFPQERSVPKGKS